MSSTIKNSKMICNGEFEIVQIDEELYDECVELFRNNFIKYENFAIACNLNCSEQTRNEMETLIRYILRDDVSFAARHIKSKQLAALCINKIVVPNKNHHGYDVLESMKSSNMKKIGEIIRSMEEKYDICREWQVNCIIELTFLSTKADFARKGLAEILAGYTIEYLRQIRNNNSNDLCIPIRLRHVKPEAITSIFTSYFSQRIGTKLGFQTLVTVPYDELSFEGIKFSDKIDPIHKFVTYAALKL